MERKITHDRGGAANLYSRRKFLALVGVAGVTAAGSSMLAGCGSSDSASSDGSGQGAGLPETDSVVIGVYSGDWEKNIEKAALTKFAEDSGIDVQIVSGADAEWVTKLQVANGSNVPYDLLILQPDSIQKVIDGGLAQDISPENVPNISSLFDSINERFTVDDKIYAAGFSMGQLGICYRTDMISEPPSSWADLWKSEYESTLGVPPLTYSAGLQFFWSQTDQGTDVDGAFDKMEQLKPNIAAFPDGAGTIQTLIQRGDISMVPFWDGRAFAWQNSDQPIGFVYPEEGAVAAIASWVIPKNAPNMKNAYKLLDYLCSADVQSEYGALSYYGMSNKDTQYSDEFLSKAKVGEEFYNGLDWVDYSIATPNLADWNDRWQKLFG